MIQLLPLLSLFFSLPPSPISTTRAWVQDRDCTRGWMEGASGKALLRRFLRPHRSILRREGCQLLVEGSPADLRALRERGLLVALLPPAAPKQKGLYHSWKEIGPYLVEMVEHSGGRARLEVLGYAREGYPIYLVSLEEGAAHTLPLIRITGAHHGNEGISVENVLGIVAFLLSDQGEYYLTRYRFQLIPVLNPVGYEREERYNGKGIDLNRDYGFGWESNQSTVPFSQPETRILAALTRVEPPALQLDFHSTAQYVNTVFDYTPFSSEEEGFILSAAQRFADGADLTPIVGYNWYPAQGSCQDFVYGFGGGLGYTVETLMPGSPDLVVEQVVAGLTQLLDYLETRSFCGRVVSEGSGVKARLTLDQISHPFFTDSQGYFCRFFFGSSMQVEVTAPFYNTVEATVESAAEPLEIPLTPGTQERGIFAIVATEDADPEASFPVENWPWWALSPSGAYSLGTRGVLVVDMGYAVLNDAGAEFQVVEAELSEETGSVQVFAAHSPFGPFKACGEYQGTFLLDLDDCGLQWARYLRLKSTSGSLGELHPGYDLQQIVALGEPASNVDGDGDGISAHEDCDDADRRVYPGAAERCDGKDNNCNLRVDDPFPLDERGVIHCTDAGIPDEEQDGGADPDGEEPNSEAGCTCTAGGSAPGTTGLWLLLLLGILGRRQRV